MNVVSSFNPISYANIKNDANEKNETLENEIIKSDCNKIGVFCITKNKIYMINKKFLIFNNLPKRNHCKKLFVFLFYYVTLCVVQKQKII